MIRRLRLIPATLALSGVLLTSCATSPPPSSQAEKRSICAIALTRFILRRIGNRRGSLQPDRSSSSERQPRQGLYRGRRPQPAARSAQRLHIEDCLRGLSDLEG